MVMFHAVTFVHNATGVNLSKLFKHNCIFYFWTSSHIGGLLFPKKLTPLTSQEADSLLYS